MPRFPRLPVRRARTTEVWDGCGALGPPDSQSHSATGSATRISPRRRTDISVKLRGGHRTHNPAHWPQRHDARAAGTSHIHCAPSRQSSRSLFRGWVTILSVIRSWDAAHQAAKCSGRAWVALSCCYGDAPKAHLLRHTWPHPEAMALHGGVGQPSRAGAPWHPPPPQTPSCAQPESRRGWR